MRHANTDSPFPRLWQVAAYVACILPAALVGCGQKTDSSGSIVAVPASPASTTTGSNVKQGEAAADESTSKSNSPDTDTIPPDDIVGTSERNASSDQAQQTYASVPEAESDQLRADVEDASTATASPKDADTVAGQVNPNPIPAPTAEQIQQWSIPNYTELELLSCYDGLRNSLTTCLAITPDGSQFFLGGERLTVHDTQEAAPVVDLMHDIPQELPYYVRCIAMSSDGKLLASGEQEGMVRIWSVESRQLVTKWQAHESRVSQIAFSPNSKTLATTSYSGEVLVWDVASMKQVRKLPVAQRELKGLIYLDNGTLAGSGGDVVIWDISGEKLKQSLSRGVFGGALALSAASGFLAYAVPNTELRVFDVKNDREVAAFKGHSGPVDIAAFSADGGLLATSAQDGTIRVWDVARGTTLQAIDAYGTRVVGLSWLPQQALLVASENGRVRLWGRRAQAEAQGLIVNIPAEALPDASLQAQPAPPAVLQRTLDTRSFPRLPDASPRFEQFGSVYYTTGSTVDEAQAFYRYVLGQDGWQEDTSAGETQSRLSFSKASHRAVVGLDPATPPSGLPASSGLNVSLRYEGNFDLRDLPKHADSASWESYSTFEAASYRTTDDITDVEVKLLKRMHAAGWTAYTRLNASNSEEPARRSLNFIQGGSLVSISLGYGAGDPGKLFVQTTASLTTKSVPIPADSGWIEFDSSGLAMELVANTQMHLKETSEFYDTEMLREGWLARDHGRHMEDDKAWLPYIRGQQDVVIRLVDVPDVGTRILVGEADRSSWQLAEPEAIDPKALEIGIEAADFELPAEAQQVDYNRDQKQLTLQVSGTGPKELVTTTMTKLTADSWQKRSAGILEDDYSFVTLTKDKIEIELRARKLEDGVSSLIISGDGLLWTKPLPAAPERISYGLWLERHRFPTTLDRLDAFREEMLKIPAPQPE